MDSSGAIINDKSNADKTMSADRLYSNIVIGFDGSEYSRAALIESSNWIKRHGGKAVMVHAVYFDEEEFGNAPEQLERRFELGRKICYQEKSDVLSGLGIDVESIICEGEPPEIISSIARERNADLIAMGTHGRKGLKRLLMGSVTSGVIVNASCDVLVVKKPCSTCTGKYSAILVPFDGSDFSKKALVRACQFAKMDGAEITVLYVIPRYEEMIGFLKTSSIKNSLFEEAQKIIDYANKLAFAEGVSVKAVIEEGSASDKIAAIADMLKNDLVIMGSYGWKGVDKAIIGSTAERVIMNAGCPVLVVR